MYTFVQFVNKGKWLILVGQVESFAVKLNLGRVRTGLPHPTPFFIASREAVRSVERYDLVKIKPTDSEAEH